MALPPVNLSFQLLSDSINMKLPAARQIQDNVTHNWEPMENMMSRLVEKAATMREEITLKGQKHKVDTPLLYQDSDRRKLSITGYLAAWSSPQSEVVDPIIALQKASSPELGSGTRIGLPEIFKVDTVGRNGGVISLINIRKAALTAVQPSYNSPYIAGIPCYCELTLEFTDIQPLSKASFNGGGGKVTVGSGY